MRKSRRRTKLSSQDSNHGALLAHHEKDAIAFARKCDSCQRFASISHQPCEVLHPILSPWPFMKWGMDIVGPLPQASGQCVFMLEMTDYFSKWIEAEAFRRVRDTEVISFIKRNVLSRFGIPLRSSATTVLSSSASKLKNSAADTTSPCIPQHHGTLKQMAKLNQVTKSSSTTSRSVLTTPREDGLRNYL
ncbi:uncharacterized protein [Spinacia oleracea]|uniref:Integrase catalytic domain-containing protein n=1 Tax=Spinacia oleracea TaxID=3562 RepID=A0ABM3RRC3_SPIOL|nr:uncharacterized protein LOC130471862 [Spinacia oleracea]